MIINILYPANHRGLRGRGWGWGLGSYTRVNQASAKYFMAVVVVEIMMIIVDL